MSNQMKKQAASQQTQRSAMVSLLLALLLLFVAMPASAASPEPAPLKTDKNKTKVAQVQAAAPVQVKKKATPPASDSGWHLKAELAMNIPLDISGRLTLEMPGRIRLSTSLGGIPGGFVDTINGAMQAANVYDKQTADVISMSFQEAIVWRLQLEWRPFANAGFYFGGGYGLLSLKGQLGGASYAGVAASLNIPSSYVTAVGYEIHSTIHMLNAEIGWEWNFFRFVTFRVAAGFTGTIASNTSVTTKVNANVPAQARQVAQGFGAGAAANLDSIYRTYVFSPTISTALGFRFF